MIRTIKQWATLAQQYHEGAQRVVGMNRRNTDFVYRHNQRKHYPLVDDKVLCKELLANHQVPTAETMDVCGGLYDVERSLERLKAESHFVVKPANGSGGKGILVVGKRRDSAGAVSWDTPGGGLLTKEHLREHLANIVFGAFGRKMSDRALIERRITPHALFLQLWPQGVCDLRIIVLRGRPLMAMLRVPTQRSSGKANLHQGGLGVAVDVELGRTYRASIKGTSIDRHPETGTALLGVQLPNWHDVLAIAKRAAAAVPLGYLGVDLVLDENAQPLVLELNARPGLEIQNVTACALDTASAKELAR